MAESSPKHGLTRTAKGWVKRINKRPKWVCSLKVAPTGETADAYYEAHFTDLWSEPEPAPPDPGSVTIGDLCDVFLARKREQRDAGRLEPKGYKEYEDALQILCDAVGAGRPAAELGPFDFAKAGAALSKRFGVHRRRKYVVMIRSVFKWANRRPVCLPPPDYGDDFRLPARSEFRKHKKRQREKHGLKMFTPEQIRAQVGGVEITRRNGRKLFVRPTPALRAMIHLGINAGFGNTDLAEMPLSVLDLNSGWLDYSRGKTGAERRAWLWPETVESLRTYLAVRPKPAKPEYAPLVFLTKAGQPFIRDQLGDDGEWEDTYDVIGERFRKLLRRLGQYRPGLNFYSLRRSARTYMAETGLELATDIVLGHADEARDMARTYTQVITDENIRKVCQHVRARVLGITA